jgi:hypothetical protein
MLEVGVVCALEEGSAAPSNRLRARVATRNTATIVAPSRTIERFGVASADRGLCVGWAAVSSMMSDRDPSGGVRANEWFRPPLASADLRPRREGREAI